MNSTYICRFVIALLIVLSFVRAAHPQDNKQRPSARRPKVIRKSTDVLKREAINRAEPVYPPLARAAKVSGSVTVEVTINEEGDVISARAISGHPLLRDSAIDAARKWRFNPTKLSSVPVEVIGKIVFDFSLNGKDAEPEEKSIATLEKQVRDTPNSDRAHYDLGEAYIKAQRYSEAVPALKEAIRINPQSPDALYELGWAYLKLERNEEAAEVLSKVVSLDPDYWRNDIAYFALGVVNLRLDRYEEAAKALTESIKISPKVLDSHLSLGLVNYHLGKYQDAIGSFKRVLEIDIRPVSGHYWLGKTYLQVGDKQSALKEYQILSRIDSEIAEQLLSEIKSK